MIVKTWKPRSLSAVIIELLQRKGPTTDTELRTMVKEIDNECGFNDLNRELMRLEIQGLIRVSALTRGKRRVALTAARQGEPEGA